jgi:hypothetical protein
VGVAPFITARATVAKVPVQFVTFAGFNLQAGEFLVEDNQPGVIAGFLSSLTARGQWDVLSITALQSGWQLTNVLLASVKELNLRGEMIEDDPYAVADLSAGYEPYLMPNQAASALTLNAGGESL